MECGGKRQRHTALDEPVVPVRCTPEESKAVSALRSATALHGGPPMKQKTRPGLAVAGFLN